MREKALSIGFLTVMFVLALLSNSLSNVYSEPITDAWFVFTISKSGRRGTLTFFRIHQGVILDPLSWSATSGDNKPEHQNIKYVGPIPEGLWYVYPENSENPDETNPPNVKDGYYPIYWDNSTNRYGRDGFYIHKMYNKSKGCICIHGDDNWKDFKKWVNSWFSTVGVEKIRLIVRYPTGRHGRSGGGPGSRNAVYK